MKKNCYQMIHDIGIRYKKILKTCDNIILKILIQINKFYYGHFLMGLFTWKNIHQCKPH